jgi:hypothetical protein
MQILINLRMTITSHEKLTMIASLIATEDFKYKTTISPQAQVRIIPEIYIFTCP